MNHCNIAFDLFRAKSEQFAKFTEEHRHWYFETMICSDPPQIQSGFLVSNVGQAKVVARIYNPVSVYCGNATNLKKMQKAFSDLNDSQAFKLNGWYEDSIFIVLLVDVVKIKWNLFIDDIRDPEYVKNDRKRYKLARSVDEAKALIATFGFPSHISFDHDLGWDNLKPLNDGSVLLAAPGVGCEAPSGFDFAKWIVDCDLDGTQHIPDDFTYSIHSSNPVGKANIDGLLSSYLKFRNAQPEKL